MYLLARTGARWAHHAYLEAADPGAGDHFGHSLALSADGTTLAVGAPAEDSHATQLGGDPRDDTAPDAGAAYLFTRDGATWLQRAYVKASNTGPGDRFGHGLALSADATTLASAAPAEDSRATTVDGAQADDTAPDAGAAYVFRTPP